MEFFHCLYYKASGTPWGVIRKDVAETTCFAGIRFFASRERQTIQTSLAQIFNELGKGIVLRGEEVQLKKNDSTPHPSVEQAFNVLHTSLKEYYEAVKIFPKRLALHKTSNYNNDEIYGCDFKPCRGREQKKGCYLIEISFLAKTSFNYGWLACIHPHSFWRTLFR